MTKSFHNIEPLYDEYSKILILGSFPSIKSREAVFYYANPQNRFWKVLKEVLLWEDVPSVIDKKKEYLHKSHIALWDVIGSCDIRGSSDSSIRNIECNDIDRIIKNGNISLIVCNGNKAYELYEKYISCDIRCLKLPSTSPANAAYSLTRLVEEWSVIRDYL